MSVAIGNTEIATTFTKRMRGMLGRKPDDTTLILAPCNDVHTFGMRYALDIAFIAYDGTVLEAHRHVICNRRLKNRRAVAVIERFSSEGEWLSKGEALSLYAE